MRKYFLLFSLGLAYSVSQAQATFVATLPQNAPTTTQLRAPNGLTSHTTFRAHFILPQTDITGQIPNGVQIDKLGFVLTGGTDIAASGTITIYLENTADATNTKSTTWSTAISAMTSVYSGSFALTTGTTTANNIDITLSTPFTYTGGGIYVAYDYLGGTFANWPATYASNSDLAGATRSNSSATTTPPASVTASSAFRPQMRFTYNNPFNNDMSVLGLTLQYGHPNRLLSDTYDVNTSVKNTSNTALNNIPVILTVTGANPVVQTQTITTLAAGDTASLTFSGLTLSSDGLQSVKISVPSDQLISNDSVVQDMIVSCDTLGYSDNSAPFDGIGFNTGSGILAARYTAPHDFPLLIKGVNVGISTGATNTGNSVYGVLLTNQGAIIATSQTVTLSAADLGTERTFTFTTPMTIPGDSSFFVGLAQTANTLNGYFPVSTQYPVDIPSNQIFALPLTGGSGSSQVTFNDLGRLMLEAIIGANVSVTSSDANDTICSGEVISYTLTPGYDFYNVIIDGSTVQSSAGNTYSVVTTASHTLTAIADRNDCPIASDTSLLVVHATPSITATASSTVICSGLSTTLTATGGTTYNWQPGNANGGVQTVSPTSNTTYTVTGTTDGCSDSDEVSVTVIVCTGIENSLSTNGIAIYPNPGQGLITVTMTNYKEQSSIIIYDALGRPVFQQVLNSEKETLNTQLPSGVYYYAILQNKQVTANGKLVVER